MQKSVALFAALFVPATLAAPALAAANGATSQSAQMHAGPGQDFPGVMRLAPNLKVTIHGCIQAWAWCDVEWRGNRGWVSAAALDYRLDGSVLSVSGYGPRVGIPQLDFNLAKYWETHYRQRPWYSEREQWTARVMTPASLASHP
jgi:uncharacterized protein YraI